MYINIHELAMAFVFGQILIFLGKLFFQYFPFEKFTLTNLMKDLTYTKCWMFVISYISISMYFNG